MNILITGGASGLGEAITKNLSIDNNNKIFFTFCKSNKKAVEIEKEFSNSKSIFCDFKQKKSIKKLCNSLDNIDLDVLINNAYNGSSINNYFDKNTLDIFTSDFSNNIIPTILITQFCIKHFKKKKKGKIITILTSFLVNSPPIGSSSYVANKAYLKSLTKSWANENIKYNITSNSISPSFMTTNFTSNVDERIVDKLIKDHPLKELLTTDEVAKTVNFLTKSTNKINGMDIVINSGTDIR